MSTPGFKDDGWYYNCYDKKTFPITPFWREANTDVQRLEFLLKGWQVNSTCAGNEFFLHPLTGYFSTPRLAVDCAMDIQRQRKWRCYEVDCMSTATYRITGIGKYGSSFKMCATHMPQYKAPVACDLWTVEELDEQVIAEAKYPPTGNDEFTIK